MKPDEVVTYLKEVWEIATTRKTVLVYEKTGLIPPPYFESGKAKEYPSTIVGEFIASHFLIHGEYGLRPQKVAEIRKRALTILYDFTSVWRKELNIQDNDIEKITDLVKIGIVIEKPIDLLVLYWILIRQNINDIHLLDNKDEIQHALFFGALFDIPSIEVSTQYKSIGTNWVHEGVTTRETKDDYGLISVLINGILIRFVHPEGFAIRVPVI